MIVRGLPLPLTTYRARRATAAAIASRHAGARGPRRVPILFIGCGEEQLRRERQDPWFDYYSGCQEPEAALLIDPTSSTARDTLFLDAGDPARIVWEGRRLGPGTQAAKLHGVHACLPKSELAARVLKAAKRAGHRLMMCTREREPGFQAGAFATWRKLLKGIELINIEPQLVHQRMYKDADEMALFREAIAITAAGLKKVLPRIPTLKRECDVASELIAEYRRVAYAPLSFPPIVGSAVHGATLHYPHNDQPLVRGAPLLIDSGATSGGYCADVTRTVPQQGRFTNRRFRAVYELVLHCNALGRAHARPGITREELNDIAWKPIIDAGFTRHHGLFHHIGLDVHDPADYSVPLAPGMVISNEPGVYLPDEGFGIRIEDDLLITADGNEELTRHIPKTIPLLEAAMRG